MEPRYNKDKRMYEIFCCICGKMSDFKKEPYKEWKCKHCGFVSNTRSCKTDPGFDCMR